MDGWMHQSVSDAPLADSALGVVDRMFTKGRSDGFVTGQDRTSKLPAALMRGGDYGNVFSGARTKKKRAGYAAGEVWQ